VLVGRPLAVRKVLQYENGETNNKNFADQDKLFEETMFSFHKFVSMDSCLYVLYDV
jgi:hypothetical protein